MATSTPLDTERVPDRPGVPAVAPPAPDGANLSVLVYSSQEVATDSSSTASALVSDDAGRQQDAIADLWRALITGAAVFGAERVAGDLSSLGGIGTIAPGVAIALVAVVLYGYRMAAGVLIGAIVYRASMGAPLWVAIAAAVGEALAVLAAAAFLRRREFDPNLVRVSDVGAMMAAGILGAAIIAAALEVAAGVAAGAIAQAEVATRWIGRWTAVAQGVLIVAPLMFTWLARPVATAETVRSAGVGILGALFLILSPVALAHAIGPQLARDVVVFAFFPIALWAAYRFEPAEASLINAFVAVAAVAGQGLGLVIIANEVVGGVLVALHGFIACFALTTLTISAINIERRVAGEALSESEARFRSLTEMANDWYWEQDTEHRFTMASHGAAAVGVDRSSLMGRRLWELPFEATPGIWSAHRKVLDARRPFRDFLLTRRLANGEIRHFLTSGDPVFDSGGRFLGYRGVVREVTAEKWAEEALRESEQRYASVFLNSSAAIIVVKIDRDGKFRFESCNQAAEALLEISAHELVGNTPEECLPEELAVDQLSRFRRCLAAGARLTDDHAFQTRSGMRYSVETLVPIRRESDRVDRIILIAIDVTEHRRAEQRARETERLFTQVFHASPVPMAFSRVDDGRVTEVNAAWLELFGGTREQALESSLRDLLTLADYQSFEAGHERVAAGGSLDQLELEVRRGGVAGAIDILYSAEALELAGVRSIVSTVVDVTERKRNEAALRQSQERFSKVFHSSPIPMFVVDFPQCRLVEVNDAWAKFLGLGKDDAIGRPADDPHIWLPPTDANQPSPWIGIRAGRHVPSTEQQVRQRGGQVLDMLVSAEPIELHGEQRMIVSLIDISDLKRTEKKLKESQRRFQDFAEAAGEYVWETDATGFYTWLSPRVESVTGYSDQEMRGRRPDEFMPVGEPERVRDWINANRRPDGSYRNLEHRLFNKKGGPVWQLVNAVPIPGGGFRGTALDVSERKRAEARIEDLATRDPLTNLPNRRTFEDQLVRGTANAQRTGQLLALMFIDLDRFKTVNDTLGHQVGDSLLKEVASRLFGAIRKGDTLSRFGGDEFVILLEGLKAAGDAGTVAQKVVAELSAPCVIDGHSINTSCSIGISVFPNDATDISTLMRHADAAMYAAKAAGRDTYRFFSPDMHARTVNPTRLGFEIRVALDRDEFRLLFQPRVALADGRVTAAHASLRWRHPSRGLLPPERFIKVAEEAGLARPLGEWMLDRAAQQVKEWRVLPDLDMPIAVGLSGVHLSPSLGDLLRETIDRHGIDPSALEVELSEATLMRNIEESRTFVAKLSEMGVRVLVEDFGSGYSSVQYLRRLPVAGVKIAPSFVREVVSSQEDRAVVRALVGMARNLDISVIAEGVETTEELEVLRELGCTEYSGAFHTPPLPPVDFEQRMLRETNISRLPSRRATKP